VASNSATIPCVALEQLKRRLASVVPQDELRNYFRSRRMMGEAVSLLQQRQAFLSDSQPYKPRYEQPPSPLGDR
jgi:hypothetical protein